MLYNLGIHVCWNQISAPLLLEECLIDYLQERANNREIPSVVSSEDFLTIKLVKDL